MTWGDKGPRITCIGKGITFDSGGLDIKPSSGMEIMKKDMGGAAHVLGLAKAIMAMGLEIRLRVLIPAAENAISALAMRPLDIIDTAAGIPVEVGNTDAEGRLVLADALHLATQQDNDLIVDFATLTGAARVALGTELPAMFTNQDELAQAMSLHAQKTNDPVWRLPLHAPYGKQLDQGHAAFSSTGASRYGGAITAALFLERFLATPQPWMHFDVMAWNLGARPGRPKGGEAMAMRAVFSLISEMANT
jgi:leucyl aminopeptidase